MAARKRKPGAPVTVGADAVVNFRLPERLKLDVDAAARAEGLSATEWWRRAARTRLGLPEIQPRPERGA